MSGKLFDFTSRRPVAENDFDIFGTLREKISFTALVVIESITEREKVYETTGTYQTPEERKKYWILSTKRGFRMSCWDEKVKDRIKFYTPLEVRGKVAISKGSTYFNVEKVDVFNSKDYSVALESGEVAEEMEG